MRIVWPPDSVSVLAPFLRGQQQAALEQIEAGAAGSDTSSMSAAWPVAGDSVRKSAGESAEFPTSVKGVVAMFVPSGYSNNVSTRCACTIASLGDHTKIVKRPSCEATRASVLC